MAGSKVTRGGHSKRDSWMPLPKVSEQVPFPPAPREGVPKFRAAFPCLLPLYSARVPRHESAFETETSTQRPFCVSNEGFAARPDEAAPRQPTSRSRATLSARGAPPRRRPRLREPSRERAPPPPPPPRFAASQGASQVRCARRMQKAPGPAGAPRVSCARARGSPLRLAGDALREARSAAPKAEPLLSSAPGTAAKGPAEEPGEPPQPSTER